MKLQFFSSIMFRAWDQNNQQMIYCEDWSNLDDVLGGYGLVKRFDYWLGDKKVTVKAPIFMRFSGVMDSNNRYIYESDIVQAYLWPDGIDEEDRGLTTFEIKYGIGGYNSGVYPFVGFYLENKHWDDRHDCLWRCKIIGNIYENPELLEPPKDEGNG